MTWWTQAVALSNYLDGHLPSDNKNTVPATTNLARACPNVAIHTLVRLNSFVFVLWWVCFIFKPRNSCDLDWMKKHFCLPYDPRTRQSRPHTWLTYAFSHAKVIHFLLNMTGLISVGNSVVAEVGSYRKFFYLYIASMYASVLGDDYIFRPITNTRWYQRFTAMKRSVSRSIHRAWARILLRGKKGRVLVTPTATIDSNGNVIKECQPRKANVALPRIGASGALYGILPWWGFGQFQQFKAAGRHDECVNLAFLFGWQILDEFCRLDSPTVGHGVHLGGLLFGVVSLLGRWLIRTCSGWRGTMIRPRFWTRIVSNSPPHTVPHTMPSLLLHAWTNQKQDAPELTFLE